MNAIALLMGLLVLAYLGSFLVGERAIRGFGLPSGAEYVVLGFLLGPHLLGLVDSEMGEAFQPIAQSANSWLAMIIGLEVGWVGTRVVPVRRLFLGALFSLTTGALIALSIAALLLVTSDFSKLEIAIVAGGIGAACSETTRHVVRWVVERYQAKGPLSELIAELADADDVVPLLALAAIFSIGPNPILPDHTLDLRIAITIGLGVVLGIISAMLLRGEWREHEAWAVLIGTSLLAFGLADALAISTLTVAFTMGLTLNVVSKHAHEVRAMVAPTERPVMLPALLLAGAHVSWTAVPHLWAIVSVALLARIGGKLIAGLVLRALAHAAAGTSPMIGAGLVSSGALSMGIGLTIAYRFPGVVGDTVLVTSALVALAGEFIAPASLRRALASAGEIAT